MHMMHGNDVGVGMRYMDARVEQCHTFDPIEPLEASGN